MNTTFWSNFLFLFLIFLFEFRFTMKLLSQMATIFNVKSYLLESNLYVSRFCKLITEETDVFMQEFSTRLLAELTKDLFGVEQLATALDINYLFELMKSTDPDVKKNSIEIIYNMLQNPFMINVVVNCKVLLPKFKLKKLTLFFTLLKFHCFYILLLGFFVYNFVWTFERALQGDSGIESGCY